METARKFRKFVNGFRPCACILKLQCGETKSFVERFPYKEHIKVSQLSFATYYIVNCVGEDKAELFDEMECYFAPILMQKTRIYHQRNPYDSKARTSVNGDGYSFRIIKRHVRLHCEGETTPWDALQDITNGLSLTRLFHQPFDTRIDLRKSIRI